MTPRERRPGEIIDMRTTRYPDGSWEQVYERVPQRHVGRCKKDRGGCGKGHTAIVLSSIERKPSSGSIVQEFETDRSRMPMGRHGGPIVKCVCGRLVSLLPVLGKYVAGKVCNAKCMAATGPSCECSCAGKNHGASW